MATQRKPMGLWGCPEQHLIAFRIKSTYLLDLENQVRRSDVSSYLDAQGVWRLVRLWTNGG